MNRLIAFFLSMLFAVAPAFATTTSKLKNNLNVTGNLTVGGNVAITGNGVASSNINTGAVKRKIFTLKPTPAGGAAASNTTVYFNFAYPGRACVVKQITYATDVDPVSGTNTIKVLKNSSSGNTMLSTASVSLNGTTINTATVATLTATAADLTLAATDSIYAEFSAGTQGAAAKDVTVTVEVELTDF